MLKNKNIVVLITLLVNVFLCDFVYAEEEGFLRFTENKNQWESAVLYRSDFRGGRLFAEKNAFTIVLKENDIYEKIHHNKSNRNLKLNLHALKINFINANPNPVMRTSNAFDDYANYFIGDDPTKWAANVKSYKQVIYENMYQGIDVNLYSDGGNIKYDYIVKPGADVKAIKTKFTGADSYVVNHDRIILKTSVGELQEYMPKAYQLINGKEKNIRCHYTTNRKGEIEIVADSYDKTKELIIDPTLVFATFTGSTSDNWGMTATYDNAGNAYSGGIATGAGYPTTVGAIQAFYAGGGAGNFYISDISITKFSANGNLLLYSTYLGGSDNEQPSSLVVNSNNELIVLGRTFSSNFPTSATAYDKTFNGLSDLILSKINVNGTQLLGSTYIGGNNLDGVNSNYDEATLTSIKFNYCDDNRGEVVVDNNDNIYVASSTMSTNFPKTAGAFQTNFMGVQEGCVFKMNSELTTLDWSSFLGGSDRDAAYALQIDKNGNVFVTGGTISNNLNTTPGVLNSTYQGGFSDGFIAKIDNTGSSLLACSYIGTSSYDQSYFVQLDRYNNVYLFGQSTGNYSVSAGVYSNAGGTQFIQKLDNNLSTSIFSTIFGSGSFSNVDIVPSAFLVDNCENIYISGWGGNLFGYNNTGSNTFGLPITPGAFQSSTDGSDFYFMALTKDAKTLWYATYFGGGASQEHVDGGTSRFDKSGVIYQSVCGGCGSLSDMPTTPGVWSQTNRSPNCNNAIIKFKFDLIATIASFHNTVNSLTGCAPFCANFNNLSMGGVTYRWEFGDGDTSAQINPIHCYDSAGTYTVMLVTYNPQSCNLRDTAYGLVKVFPALHIPPLRDTAICKGSSVSLQTINQVGMTYKWQPPTSLSSTTTYNTTATPTSSIFYNVKVTDGNGCWDEDTVTIIVNENLTKINVLGDTVFCKGDSVQLMASQVNRLYHWSNNDSLQIITVYDSTGFYYLTATDVNDCIAKDTVHVRIKPMPIPNASRDTSICLGNTVSLNANDGDTFVWTPATYLSSGIIANPVTTPTNSIRYFVTVSKEGCISEDTVDITVNKNTTQITINGDSTFCTGDSVQLSSNGQHALYLWYTNKNTQNIYATQSGNYWLKTTDANGCSGYDTVVIKVLTKVTAYNDTTVCGGQYVPLFASGSNATYSWSPAADFVNANVQNASVFVTTSKNYYLTASDACNEDSVYINVIPYPVIKASEDTSIFFGEKVQLSAVGDVPILWTPKYKLSCDHCPNPMASPDTSTSYIVEVKNQFGCWARDTVKVKVKEIPTLYIPNSFTPNNDHINDLFKPYFNALKSIEWKVFDRWGTVVYEATDFKDAWDGSYKNANAQQDVYVYRAIAITINGERINKVGTVTLIR